MELSFSITLNCEILGILAETSLAAFRPGQMSADPWQKTLVWNPTRAGRPPSDGVRWTSGSFSAYLCSETVLGLVSVSCQPSAIRR